MADCVGCGHCCMTATCVAGVIEGADATGRCRFLVWNGSRYVCDLVALFPGYAELLYVGAGCCQGLNSWRADVKYRG